MNTTPFNSTNAALDYSGYAYNNANQRTEQWRGAATTSTAVSTNYANYTYDPIGQLTSDLAAELIGSTNRMNEQLHYVYDAAGNLAYRTNNTLVEKFQVNSVNELTTGTNGGRLTVMGTTSSQATNVTVNGTNALLYGDATFAATNMPLTTAYTAIARDGYGRINTNTATVSLATNSSFQYDLNGNLTNDGTMSFGYDDENQLTQVWVPNQWFSQFSYDGKMRRRIRQEFTWSGGWVQTNIVYYVYDGNVVIEERDVNHLPSVSYARGKDLSGRLQGAGGIGGLLARTDDSAQQTAFYHADGNGNVTMLVNSYQAVVAKYLYDAFGNTLSLSGPIAYANRYRFSSKEAHQNSGLEYYLYRYYDPNLQRWPNRDPIGEAGGINLYGFVGNNPVSRIDPYGLQYDPNALNLLVGKDPIFGPWGRIEGRDAVQLALLTPAIALGAVAATGAALEFGAGILVWLGIGGAAVENPATQEELEEAEAEAANLLRAANTVSKCAKPALQRIHPMATYEADPEAAASLQYWRTQPTDKILESLKPGNPESLRTWLDGRMMNGNTRTLVLEERGFPINSLPREVQVVDPNTGIATWVTVP